MIDMIQSTEGLVHFISGIIALITGTTVLLLKKATKLHIWLGYVYVISMIILLISSFMIYRLFDGWGIFHYASIVSTVSIIIGILPAVFLKHKSYWSKWHLKAMYWSVVGLWSAFVAEMSIRIPESSFIWMTGIAFGIVFFIGIIIFGIKKKEWIFQAKHAQS